MKTVELLNIIAERGYKLKDMIKDCGSDAMSRLQAAVIIGNQRHNYQCRLDPDASSASPLKEEWYLHDDDGVHSFRPSRAPTHLWRWGSVPLPKFQIDFKDINEVFTGKTKPRHRGVLP